MVALSSLAKRLVLALVLSGATNTAPAQDGLTVTVALELVLAVDTSASVDADEFNLQIQGIADAFRDPDIVDSIEANGEAGIAVALMQWSSGDQQVQSGKWHQIMDSATADRFARMVETSERLKGNTTAIGSALHFAHGLLNQNGFDARRSTIDVAGDGRNNSGIPLLPQRDRILASGISINGLAVLDGDPGLQAYYERFVAGGSRAFVIAARDFEDFDRAMRQKLLREIRPVFADLHRDKAVDYQSKTTLPEFPERMASKPD